MIRRPPRSTRTDTLFPYTTLFRSHREQAILPALQSALILAEDARAFLEQHDATVIGIDVARDDAGRIARHGAVHRGLEGAGDDRASGDEVVAVADHARRGGADCRGLLEGVEVGRSEERRVGKECVSTVSSRWSAYP